MKKQRLMMLSFLFSSLCFGQTSDTLGYFVEGTKAQVTCIVVKPLGLPMHMHIRTNRPDVFFDQIKQAATCLKEIIPVAHRRDMNDRHIYFSSNLPSLGFGGSMFYGEYLGFICKKFKNNNGRDMAYEFSFPILSVKEVDMLIHETPLQICLNETREVKPKEEEQRHPSMMSV